MKFRCVNCHHEIKQTPVVETRRKFCHDRCGEHWKRRMMRQQAEQKTAAISSPGLRSRPVAGFSLAAAGVRPT